jgi:hypothetical protein
MVIPDRRMIDAPCSDEVRVRGELERPEFEEGRGVVGQDVLGFFFLDVVVEDMDGRFLADGRWRSIGRGWQSGVRGRSQS